jgi:hypothetical protein
MTRKARNRTRRFIPMISTEQTILLCSQLQSFDLDNHTKVTSPVICSPPLSRNTKTSTILLSAHSRIPAPAPHQQQHRKERSLTPPRIPLRKYYDHETNDILTALHLFCRSGSRHKDIMTIIELHPQLISQHTPKGGDTPLHFAVAAHDLQATRLLLEKQPDAACIKSNQRGNFGSKVTPLHVAILTSASHEIIDALVRASPRSVKLRDGNGQTAHRLAVQHYTGDSLGNICTHLHTCL